MGYHIFQNHEQSKFHIKAENKNKALEAVKSLFGQEATLTYSGNYYAWVNDDYKDSTNLEDALKAWRWLAKNDNDGNIVELIFEGEKYGDDALLFDVIAPFVEDDCQIKMFGEDGRSFGWYFAYGNLL